MNLLKNGIRGNDEPIHRILKSRRKRTPRYRVRRITIIGTVIVTMLFFTRILLGFFDFEHVHVSINLAANSHYKEGDIYNVLGDNLSNIITDSEAKTATYLKDSMSYVKDAYVSKNFVKRQLTIEITERVPFARLKYITEVNKKDIKNDKKIMKEKDIHKFYLIDEAGYVLQLIKTETHNNLTLILDEAAKEPEIGKQVKTGTTQRGIQILKHVRLKKPGLRKHIKSIDARISNKIIIHTNILPMPAWIDSDKFENGLHHITLFIKHNGLHLLQRYLQRVKQNNLKNKPARTKTETIEDKITYIDARYEDTLFLGGDSR